MLFNAVLYFQNLQPKKKLTLSSASFLSAFHKMVSTDIVLALTSLALAAFFLTWAWKILNWVWLRPKKLEKFLRQQGLQGNSYRLLYGDLKENLDMLKRAKSKPINLSDDIVPRVLPFIDQSIQQYGKKSFIWLGPVPGVNIMEPELIREILTKISDFRKPASNPLAKYLATGLATYEGDHWAKHRRIINPAFHFPKLQNMLPAFYQSCSEMMSSWETLASVEGSCELDAWPSLQNLTGDAISRTAFGSNYKEGKRIFQLQQELAILIIQALRSVYIPGWRFLPTKTNNKIKELDREVQALLRGIINKRERALQNGEAANDDLLGLLMESNFREIGEHGNNKKVGMSIKEVIEECKLFYLAGQETTSVLLVWTLVLLSKHQEWQERARKEVLQTFGKEKPDFEGLNHLKVMTMIFHEVLRLYPPVVMLARRTHKDMKLGKYNLPAGVQISMPTMLIHRDHDLWGEDADEFNPQRFAEGISKASKNLSYFPFGWGPRICIGMNFARVEAKLALSLILQKFAFKLSPSYAHAPSTVITLQPQHGVQLILHKQ